MPSINFATRAEVAPRRPTRLDRRRYGRIGWFLLRILAHILFWDVVLARPVVSRLRPDRAVRWRQLARAYRLFAVEMGGMLIKVGQFLAARVDLLPAEVTEELAALQDEVPPVPVEAILRGVEADLGKPVAALFTWVAPVPLGSASLAQVHEAQLPTGEQVVLKALRPGIEPLIETDLAIIHAFAQPLKRFAAVRRRVDVDWLIRELTAVTRNELNMRVEGEHAERFARAFAGAPDIYVPRIYWDYTARRTLTMENVAYIRITDVAGLREAGIAPARVAERLFDCYLEQVLVKHFVHADPHPGNLFVRPLPTPDHHGPDDGLDAVRPASERPFQLVFVDFGMAVPIPSRLHTALRHYIIGVVMRDARLIIQAYLEAGVLLPDTDIALVEVLTARLLERFSSLFLAQAKDFDVHTYASILKDYRELVYQAPFQIQADLLYVFRALGILSGLVAHLDPTLDPVRRVMPYARRMLIEEYTPTWDGMVKSTYDLMRLPARLDELLTRAQRGQLTVSAELAPGSTRRLERLERAVTRLTWLIVGMGLLLGGLWARSAGWGDSLSTALLALGCVTLLANLLRN